MPTSIVTTTPTGSTPRSTIPTTVAPTDADTPVDLSLVPETEGLSVSVSKATINGKDYTRALIVDPYSSSREIRLQINAGRRRTRFLGDLGIADNERAMTAYRVDISFDEAAPFQTTEVRFGETKPLDLDVKGVLRIKFAFTPLTAPNSSCCGRMAIGEPRLR